MTCEAVYYIWLYTDVDMLNHVPYIIYRIYVISNIIYPSVAVMQNQYAVPGRCVSTSASFSADNSSRPQRPESIEIL